MIVEDYLKSLKEGIESFSEKAVENLNNITEEKLGASSLEMWDEGVKQGKEAAKKGIVTTSILGMVFSGTVIGSKPVKAYSGETGNLANPSKVQKHRRDRNSVYIPDDVGSNSGFELHGEIGYGIEMTETELIDDAYGFENTFNTSVELRGKNSGEPFFKISKESSYLEKDIESDGISTEEEKSDFEIEAGIILNDEGSNKFYGFLKELEKNAVKQWGEWYDDDIVESEDESIIGAGFDYSKMVEDGRLKVKVEGSFSEEDNYGAGKTGLKVDTKYLIKDTEIGFSIDNSIENQFFGEDNQKAIKAGYTFHNDGTDIKPTIEFGDKFDKYGVEANIGGREKIMQIKVGMKNIKENDEGAKYFMEGSFQF